MRTGNTILVVHNIDFVGAFGNYATGERLSVDVFRGEHHIGHAAGPAVSTPEGPGLEVNHGPEGTPAPGDCWDTVTPDIRPGDRIVVTDHTGGTDSAYIDELSITGIAADTTPGLEQDVLVTGAARNAVTGEPIPAATLDSGFWRTDGIDARGEGPTVTVDADGLYTARYAAANRWAQFRGAAVNRDDVIGAGHEFGYGHAIVPLPPEIQLVEGQGESPGPAPGCEQAPAAAANAITTVSGAVNSAALDTSGNGISVGGVATTDTTDVAVTLSDGTTTIDGAVRVGTSDLNQFTDQAFTASFRPEDLATLADGNLTATATFTGGTGPASSTRTVVKDTVAPGAPTATPPAGSYTGRQFVSLSAPDASRILYTTDGSDPAGGQQFRFALTVGSSQTIRAVAIDAAGNVGPAASFAYTIGAPSNGGNPGTGGTPPAGGNPPAATNSRPSNSGAQAAASAPVIGAVVAQPAAVVAGVTATSTPQLALRGVTVPARVKRGTVRVKGLSVPMRLNAGTRVVRVRVYRRAANGRRSLVSQTFHSPRRAGLYRVKLTSKRLRSRLSSVGTYQIEITPGTSRRALGRSSVRTFRVVR